MNDKTKKDANTNTNANWAAKPYAKARGDIARLLDVLQMELDEKADEALVDPTRVVGTIQQTRSDLIDTVANVAGTERDEVERFLDEAE